MWVQVRRDATGAGWHLWLTAGDPKSGPSAGWDAWADDEAGVDEWMAHELDDVEWPDG